MIKTIARKLIFVSSPLRAKTKKGVEKNLELARRYCSRVIREGHVPVAPHLIYPQFLPLNDEGDAIAMTCSDRLIMACDEVWLFPHPGCECSAGMLEEIRYASHYGKRIRYMEGETI